METAALSLVLFSKRLRLRNALFFPPVDWLCAKERICGAFKSGTATAEETSTQLPKLQECISFLLSSRPTFLAWKQCINDYFLLIEIGYLYWKRN